MLHAEVVWLWRVGLLHHQGLSDGWLVNVLEWFGVFDRAGVMLALGITALSAATAADNATEDGKEDAQDDN